MNGQQQKVLDAFQHAPGHRLTTVQLASLYVLRYSARINELRKLGYTITKTRAKHSGEWIYTLSVERDGSTPSSSAAVSLDAQRPSTILSEHSNQSSSFGSQDGALQLFEAPESELAPASAIYGEAA